MQLRLRNLVLGLVVALGTPACGARVAGDADQRGDGANRGDPRGNTDEPPEQQTEEGTDPPPDGESFPGEVRAVYTLSANSDGSRALTIEWGNSDRSCELREVLSCGYANGSVTLDVTSVVPGAEIDLAATDGYMSASGVNEGGSGPDDCWGGGGSLDGRLVIRGVDLGSGWFSFTAEDTSFFEPTLNGDFVALECEAPEAQPEVPGPAAVFDALDDGVHLRWGNVTRSCGDSMDVVCNQAKAEVTLTESDLQVGNVVDLEQAGALEISSGVNLDGNGPDDCWWGGGPAFGELEILELTESTIRFRVSGTDWDDPDVDGIFTATRCN